MAKVDKIRMALRFIDAENRVHMAAQGFSIVALQDAEDPIGMIGAWFDQMEFHVYKSLIDAGVIK